MTPVSDNVPPELINTLCHVVRTHLTFNAGPGLEELIVLAHSTISLLEALAWNIPEALVAQYVCVTNDYACTHKDFLCLFEDYRL
jgi:hypothetical protein